MKTELQLQLIDRFKWYAPARHQPWWRKLSKNARANQARWWTFECSDGWFQLLWDLSTKIDAHLKSHPELKKHFSPTQVKEKFGGLRFYFYGGDEVIDKYVEEAEELSYTICELCGKPGKPNKEGWIKTLCPKCRKKAT